MKLVLLSSVIFSLSLFASTNSKQCKNDLDLMYKHTFKAQKLFFEKEFSSAKVEFRKSLEHSNKALQSCENNSKIDFNHIYNYIIYSDNEIDKIYSLEAD